MKNSAIGSNWKDIRSELFTKEEILESDTVAIMSELIMGLNMSKVSVRKARRTQWSKPACHS